MLATTLVKQYVLVITFIVSGSVLEVMSEPPAYSQAACMRDRVLVAEVLRGRGTPVLRVKCVWGVRHG